MSEISATIDRALGHITINGTIQLTEAKIPGTVDLSKDTVTPETLLEGITAHNSDGDPIVGTFVPVNLEADTVTSETLLSGVTAHDSNGSAIVGTFVPVVLTEDTVSPENLLIGATAHDKDGNEITGTLKVVTVRTGEGEPTDDLGEDGDWYLVTEGV